MFLVSNEDLVKRSPMYSNDKMPLENILTGQELSQPFVSWYGSSPLDVSLSLLEHPWWLENPWWLEELLEDSQWNNPSWIVLLTVASPSNKIRLIENMARGICLYLIKIL